MSICRWSSDDYQSDLYVYESAEGFMIHVSNGRYVTRNPLPEPIPKLHNVGLDSREWAEHAKAVHDRSQLVHRMICEAAVAPIGLPCDGKTFVEPSAEACAARIQELIDMGYRVPDGVVEGLLEEAEGEGSDGRQGIHLSRYIRDA
jgi:hypothetical protein